MENNFEVDINEFRLTEFNNSRLLSEVFKKEIKLFENFFDIQLKILKNHFTGFLDPYYELQEYERIIIQSFLKTNHLLYTANNLTIQGNYGAANIVLRQIFEFLLLGKYVSYKKDEKMATKWLNKGQFDIYDKIIKYLEKPNKKSFHDFWILICKFSHASTVSTQINLKAPSNITNIRTTYMFVLLFQRCNYHLLYSCLLNKKLIYFSEFYCGLKSENTILKKEARIIKTEIYSLFTQTGTKLIKDFESSWVFKTQYSTTN